MKRTIITCDLCHQEDGTYQDAADAHQDYLNMYKALGVHQPPCEDRYVWSHVCTACRCDLFNALETVVHHKIMERNESRTETED